MEDEIEDLYSDRWGTIHDAGIDRSEMGPPHGDFLVLVDEGRAVGCGAIRRIDDEACEIKRMYVAPELRGRGLSRELLRALEQRAGELGYRTVRLDTGDRQPAAERLYRGAGYRSIPSYNENYLATLWFEKPLP